jgi:AraC-like DNA-binding protein
MNMTFYEYLNSKRVKKAEELLYHTKELSITEVAMGAGFSSISAFNRTFKMIKNCSPSDYRKIRYQGIVKN